MAARPVAMTGVMYPLNKKDPPVPCYIVGNAWDPSLSIGGGPIEGTPPIIWGPPGPWPTPPIYLPGGPVDPGYSPPWARPPVDPGYSPPWARPPVDPGYSPPWARPKPPGIWGPTDPMPTPPIYWPGFPVWPPIPPGGGGEPPQIPAPPNPGDPVTPIPPPAGSTGWPVSSMVPPPFVVINYPGIGPVVVPQPEMPAPTPPLPPQDTAPHPAPVKK